MIFDSEKTAGPIATGKIPFDAPKRKKGDGTNCGATGPNQHVPRAVA